MQPNNNIWLHFCPSSKESTQNELDISCAGPPIPKAIYSNEEFDFSNVSVYDLQIKVTDNLSLQGISCPLQSSTLDIFPSRG